MKFTAKRLSELQALNLPKCTPAIFEAKIPDDAPDRAHAESLLAEMAKYLEQFTQSSECICCGSKLGAKDIVDSLLSGAMFRWGLAHGEGNCSKCGYPARAHHRIGDWFTLQNYILQYHPSELSFSELVEAQ